MNLKESSRVYLVHCSIFKILICLSSELFSRPTALLLYHVIKPLSTVFFDFFRFVNLPQFIKRHAVISVDKYSSYLYVAAGLTCHSLL